MLEQYYNAMLYSVGMPSFSDLTAADRARMEKSLGFSLYKIGRATASVITALKAAAPFFNAIFKRKK